MAPHKENKAGASADRRLEQLAALAFAAADVLFEVDRVFRIRHVGGAIAKLVGHPPTAVRGLSLFDLIAPQDRIFLRRVMEAFDREQPVGRLAMRFLHAGTPELVTAIVGMSPMPGVKGERLVTATILDRTFVADAGSDGFLDRTSFIDLARRLVPSAEEKPRFEVVMLALPPLMKDSKLRSSKLGMAFAAEAEAILRLNSEGGAVTRLGEDSFAFIQKAGEDPSVVEQKIIEATDVLLAHPRSQTLPLDASLMEQEEVEAALEHALATFARHSADCAPVTNLPDCLAASARQDRELVASCRSIIEDATFFQVLQPILTLKTGIIQHYEVLTRFAQGVARGISNTSEFIQIAEQVGMINTFDLVNCVKTIKLLQKLPASVRLALNVSGRSVQSAEFAERLRGVLEGSDTQVAPSRLLIEITETRGITEFEQPCALLQYLFQRGHRICLDDFGAGAMSFEYLRRFPVSYVKIDGPFFRNAMISGRDRILVRTIARCAFELGCRTVAEMIETEAESALARELGIECGQGWLFGKPVTADVLMATFSDHPPRQPAPSRMVSPAPTPPPARRVAAMRSGGVVFPAAG
ncbi:EAL domain-containing protein [Acetobacter estunensis]|uniref:EAL domain-containing protein n=1 Tax=Acetobacter estunensis TaxID=104097 RepID=UPI001C2DCB58|nr:EAL domain-containing protein [Acetobacter estunensis]MBV1835765.1 EAL domain-containing protein [Acetobacter estunensis]MBV1835974.1 EAL domain-containing protein [Acetobacter estunensis]